MNTWLNEIVYDGIRLGTYKSAGVCFNGLREIVIAVINNVLKIYHDLRLFPRMSQENRLCLLTAPLCEVLSVRQFFKYARNALKTCNGFSSTHSFNSCIFNLRLRIKRM